MTSEHLKAKMMILIHLRRNVLLGYYRTLEAVLSDGHFRGPAPGLLRKDQVCSDVYVHRTQGLPVIRVWGKSGKTPSRRPHQLNGVSQMEETATPS